MLKILKVALSSAILPRKLLVLFPYLDQGVTFYFRDLHMTFPTMVAITPQAKKATAKCVRLSYLQVKHPTFSLQISSHVILLNSNFCQSDGRRMVSFCLHFLIVRLMTFLRNCWPLHVLFCELHIHILCPFLIEQYPFFLLIGNINFDYIKQYNELNDYNYNYYINIYLYYLIILIVSVVCRYRIVLPYVWFLFPAFHGFNYPWSKMTFLLIY